MDLKRKILNKTTVTDNECWEWDGERKEKGYGRLYSNKKRYRAHRVAYQEFVGDIPDDLHVLHRCDNPPCCNPAHLFLGTNQDNIKDRMRKNRNAKDLHTKAHQ